MAAALLAFAPSADARDAFGLWLTKDRDAKVRVSDCGGSLCGTIVWLSQPIDKETGRPVTDKMNADPARRSRPMIGVRIFGMQPAGSNRWTGSIYNADDGKTYTGSVELLDAESGSRSRAVSVRSATTKSGRGPTDTSARR